MRYIENGIEHKCPCCGYEVEWDWKKNWESPIEEKFIKGDESFIKIENGVGRTTTFETDKPRKVDYGEPAYETVYLLGCPKCGCVSYKIL